MTDTERNALETVCELRNSLNQLVKERDERIESIVELEDIVQVKRLRISEISDDMARVIRQRNELEKKVEHWQEYGARMLASVNALVEAQS